MYNYKGVSYTLNQIEEAAKQSNMSVSDYVKKLKEIDHPQPEPDKEIESADLLDPTTFQTDAVAGADAVSKQTQAPSTELVSEGISLDLQKPKTKKEIEYEEIDNIISKAGTSLWGYDSTTINDLYSKVGETESVFKTIGLFNKYKSILTGDFSYYDFSEKEKINGFSINELQEADKSKAANEAFSNLLGKYGDKSNEFVLNQGVNILKGKDEKLKKLYSSLKTADDKEKQRIINEITKVREDGSQELYDINTGSIIKYDDLPDEHKAEEEIRVEKANEIAQTTELDEIKNQLTKSYSNLVGISKRISQFVNENTDYELTKSSQTGISIMSNIIKDFFGSEETIYGDLERVNQIASTGELPSNVSKINGDHPLAKAYNDALEDYAILNKAIQTNTDPLSEEQEGFWSALGSSAFEKIDISEKAITPYVQAEVNKKFTKSMELAGLGRVNEEEVSEALSQNWRSTVGGGAPDLAMFVGEVFAFRRATGNTIAKTSRYINNAFNATKAAKSSRILRGAGNFVIKGLDEAATFTALESTKTTLNLSKQSTREQEWATATFGFSLGGGNSIGSGLLRALPSKTIFSPVIAQLSKSDVARRWGTSIVNANAGAFSFEFARALEATLGEDEEGYLEQSPEEFIKGYLAEVAKMGLLGSKSIFAKNGMLRAAQNDMRLLKLNPVYVNTAAKKTGISPESVKNPNETIVDEINQARQEKISDINIRLEAEDITKEQAEKETQEANKNYNILEAEAELNLAKERLKAEDKSALKPSDTSIRILIQKMKKGEKFNEKDNNALVNTPLPLIYDRMGIDPSTKSLNGLWNREFVIEDILNNNTSFKAPYGSKERKNSYEFVSEFFDVGGKVEALKKIPKKSQEQEKELEQLEKDLEAYKPGGYKYDKLQSKLDEYYLKQRQENKAQAAEVLGATKEGESISIRSVEDFQKKAEEVTGKKDDVRETDGFYDPVNKVFYINESYVKDTRNITVDKHEAGHFILRDSFKNKLGDVTEEGIKLIDEVLSELTPKQREIVQKRIDENYRYDVNGKELPAEKYYEEYLTVLSDAITEKSIVFRENVGNALEKFVPFLRKKGMPELELNASTGKNLFELIKSYSKGEKAGIEAAKEISIAAEGVDVKDQKPLKSLSRQSSEEVNKIYKDQGLAGVMDILEILRPTAVGLAKRFENRPKYEKQLVVDAIMTGKRGMLDVIMSYDKKVQDGEDVGPLSGYINNSFSTKTGFKRYIENVEKIVGKEFTEDVSEARDVVAAEVTDDVTLEKEVRVVKKPTETTKFKPNYLDPKFKKSLDPSKTQKEAIEDKISSTIKESFKDRPVSGFKQTGKIPQKLAQLYADMFGIKTTSALIEKQRNLQKLDEEGAIKARQFLVDNAQSDFARLPRSKDDMGKATGILQTKIGKVLYNKAGKLTGSLKTYTDIIKGKNITLEGYDGKQYEFNKLDETGKKKPIYRDAQHIKAALDFHIRNRALETLIPEPAKRAQAGAKFSRTGIGKQIDKNIENVGAKVLTKSVEDNNKFRNYLLNTLTGVLGKDANRIIKPGDVAGAGNSAIGSRKSSGALGRGFRFIGNIERTQRFIPETKKALEEGRVMDLEVLRKEISQAPELFSPEQVKDIIAATSSQTRASMKKNKVNKDAIKRGRNLILNSLFKTINEDVNNLGPVRELLYNQNANTSFARKFATVKSIEDGLKEKEATWEEHVFQFGNWANRTLQAFASKDKKILDGWLKWSDDNYYQEVTGKETQGIVDGSYPGWKAKFEEHPYLKEKLDEAFKTGDFSKVPSSDIRKYNEFFTLNPNNRGRDGITDAQRYNVEVDSKFKNNKNVIAEQGRLIYQQFIGEITAKQAKDLINEYVKLAKNKTKSSKVNNNNTPSNVKFDKKISNEEVLDNLGKIDKALSIARNPNSPVKKIRVFDFDDTLARSKSRVIYEMPDGKTGFLTATEFANKAGEMEANGATFDFSEFSKVVDGKKGPLFEVAKFINEAKGERDVFVLTARPADAAGPIKEFLGSMGLNIPLKNITGLGDGTPQAKARWMVDKAAEGYNDFYFADDASKNVKAVKEALDVLDVKSKVQQAQVRFSKTSLDKQFNDIIEAKTGIASEKRYGKAKAQVAGASRGKAIKFVPYSAQDFVGLLYETLSKGKLGDSQMAWYQENLIRPFARAMNDLSSARLAMMNDYRALKKELKIVPKNLRKKIKGEPWTKEQAVRVYIWNKQGLDIPGISKTDLKDLTEHVANNAELQVFADQLIAIQKGDAYPAPKESWVSGSISTDLLQGLNTVKRAKYLEQWQRNVDEIFSQENKNKLQAAYGEKYVKALENSLQRMKTGRNRTFSDDSLTGRFTDWLQGSVGAIMFFNTRSALLQTISAANFINFTDNNPIAAARAFGNQKQYWKDFTFLINSDFLKERREGLRMNVSESDIADMAKREGPRGVINKLLQLGFAPTQIADSFAIASGGATFYRNRIKTYVKDGLDQKAAEQKAFEDFRENAEESQQSSRPDRISMQQAGPLGRLILAFANTPAQYARLTDKAIRDLKNGRGDAKTNISKIIYYIGVQNLIFNAVQQALFAISFGDEEEDEKKQEKYLGILNGMSDSVLRGTGFAGAAISVGKNSILRIMKEAEKKRPKFEKVGYELTKISPPISAKLSRINQAARAYQWNKEEMKTKGFSLDNPAFLAGGNVVSALTNIPLDRAVKKVNNVVKATESDLELWERLALFGGWQDWEIGLKKEAKKKKKKPRKKETYGTITFDEF